MKHLHHLFVKKLAILFFGSLFSQPGFSQYYYRDIILPAQNAAQQQLYKKNKVQQANLLSFEADGTPSQDFNCEIKPNIGFTQIRTITKSVVAGNSSITAFYNFKGQIYKSVDSTKETVSVYEYAYDSTGKLLSASNITTGIMDKTKQGETHIWTYNVHGAPENMLYIKNNRDTIIVKFLIDESGNVIEEENWRNHISLGKTYYYYDSLNRLTDIVRYNARIQKLIPDYIFEYNDKNQVVQMINTQQGSGDYLIWKYIYNEKGLRTEERCYNKQKRIMGRIEYQYNIK